MTLTIETDSKTTLEALTKYAKRNEDMGYIDVENGELLRRVTAILRARQAHVIFKWIKGHSGHPRNEGADRLAAKGAGMEPHDDNWMSEDSLRLRVPGAKLMSMSQRLAYKEIRRRKTETFLARTATRSNLSRISNDINLACGSSPTEESIWRGLSKKHVTRECKQFLWKAIHQAFWIGDLWLRPSMPADLRARAACQICGTTEDMNHILFECAARERTVAWKLTKDLWTATAERWYEPNWGTVIGSPCLFFEDPSGRRRQTVEARWTIIATETAYLIWKLRCERVIQHEGASFAEDEVQRRWRATMEGRMKMDRWSASNGKSKMTLQRHEVDSIWKPLLASADTLPLDWVRNVGVLVGIR
ncbi:hypothetical protein PYCCODRAFT_1393188, partial [Trametes coccinea BRFM310]